MNSISRLPPFALLIPVAFAVGCSGLPKESGVDVRPITRAIVFKTDIRPIFETSCIHCHDGDPVAGRLNLKNRTLAFQQPEAQFIVPGHPEKSRLLSKITLGDNDPGAMPPTGHALDAEKIARLSAWIKQGANWPAGSEGEVKPSSDMNWRSH